MACILPEHGLTSGHCPFAFSLLVRLIMRLLLVIAVAAIPACSVVSVNSAAAQDFNDRWSIIPKAHAEPAPEAPDQAKQNSLEQPPIGQQPQQSSDDRFPPRASGRAFSGRASFY